MNKKVIAVLIIVFVICIGVVAIILLNNKTDNSNANVQTYDNLNSSTSQTNNTDIQKGSKSLVLYFSATGNTEKIAKNIQYVINSDIIEIKPKQEYTAVDLNYNDDNCRANKEQYDENARPKIESIPNIDNYDIIYLGYPIWWGDVPKVILTLLDNYNLDNKTIIPFCTSGSSGISQSINTLKSYNPNANWIEGKRFTGLESESDIKEWIDNLNINDKKEESKMYINVNDKILIASLENNSSADALIEKLKQSDITINMHDYANFEKVGELGFNLPTNDTNITTTAGDIILYQGNQITIYYDTNNWNFTKLGHINDISQDELKQILGKDDVTVTLSLEK